MPSDRTVARLPHVEANKVRGRLYLYYRRDGRRLPLRGPEGSAAFLSDYDSAEAEFEHASPWGRHTVGQVITEYLASADFQQLERRTQRNYRLYLDQMRDLAGNSAVVDVDVAWVDRLRDRMAPAPYRWNAIRSRMKEVFGRYRRLHPDLLPINPWAESGRLAPPTSTQNRRWPDEVLLAVLQAATPEFRALLVTLLLTSQRIGDVTKFRPNQYDLAARTLGYVDINEQEKVNKRLVLHVPDGLASVFEAMSGRHPDRLLVTPRGKAWTVLNAEETLLVLRRNLGLPRYTLHGLRKTGLSALKMLGMENRRLRALSGHDSDRNLEVYLDGVDSYAMAHEAQEALEKRFAPIINQSKAGANTRRFSGSTGRAAGNATRTGGAGPSKGENVSNPEAANRLPNAKLIASPIEKT